MTGLELLRAIGSGELPAAPMAELMGLEPLAADEGRVAFAAEPDRGTRTRWVWRTAGSRRPCSTPPWAVPCTRRCPRAWAIRRSS